MAMSKGKRKSGMLHEPPAIMLTDLAFNLLIFFVVCASTEPETGRRQNVPSGNKQEAAAAQAEQNIEVTLTKSKAAINGVETPDDDIPAKIKTMQAGKTKPEQRVVVVKTRKDTPYHYWIKVTGLVEQAGGIVAIEVEKNSEVQVK
jgi:biopolymer transport protein ExbD